MAEDLCLDGRKQELEVIIVLALTPAEPSLCIPLCYTHASQEGRETGKLVAQQDVGGLSQSHTHHPGLCESS